MLAAFTPISTFLYSISPLTYLSQVEIPPMDYVESLIQRRDWYLVEKLHELFDPLAEIVHILEVTSSAISHFTTSLSSG